MKALIVDEPWISLILCGKKTWEMRKTACHQRGRIGLIRKGSGQVVGVADLSGSLPPLGDLKSYSAAEPRHCIPPGRQAQAFADGWRTPWDVSNAEPLARPVAYCHPPGAVIWVKLDPEVAEAVLAQSGGNAHQDGVAAHDSLPSLVAGIPIQADIRFATADSARHVTVTGGNLRNGHLYLPLDFFPTDAIGGKNIVQAAPRTINVVFRPGTTIETDIDGTKRILRARAGVRDFFDKSHMREGETVQITRISTYLYEVASTTVAHSQEA